MMKFKGLFNLPKHRQFGYEPMYYDEEKEEQEKRAEFMEGAKRKLKTAEDYEKARERISDAFQARQRPVASTVATQAMIALLVSGLLIALYVYFGDYLDM
ncbi:MAG: preprotein translocase subunit SecF [Flammeovirgaceae bacterium]|jgi:preprotein translocase subunit SecF